MNAVELRRIWVFGIMCVLTGNASVTSHAQNAKKISDHEACERVKTMLPLAQKLWGGGWSFFGTKITGTRLTPTGFVLSAEKKPDYLITYKNVQNVEQDGHDIDFHMQDSTALMEVVNEDVRGRLTESLQHLIDASHAGRSCDCTRPPIDSEIELDAFSRSTAPWRALATKPPLSDEVTKKRLLAEDAIEHRNVQAAADYYDAGVSIDPTWAQGWYNAALLYAEQQDYLDAAAHMKHYLILLPDAADAGAAKEKVLLWEAKTEEAR